MYNDLKPEHVQYLIADPAVNNEFLSKTRELNRRLRKNNLDYKFWDTMTDHQHEIFSDDLFLTGQCAGSVEDYVHGAASSCGCPDVVEDLHHHSPALMQGIERYQNGPAMGMPVAESLSPLNEFIDSQAGLLKEASSAVQKYEQRVVDSLKETGIIGSMKVAHADATGPDAEFIVDGQAFFLEIKLNSKAQMGDTAVRYYPARSDNKFMLAKPDALDEAAQAVVFAALDKKEEDILNWVEALRDPARPASEKWVDNPEKSALGFQTTYRKYQEAKESGLLLKAGAGYGKATPISAPGNVIKRLYASKGVYYIQIGGKGLYYLENNPANLPVPPFDGEINIELRPRPSGRVKTKDLDPETGTKVVTGYKTWESAVEGDDRVVYYGGTYSVTARFVSKDLEPSPFSMDDPGSIQAMLNLRDNSPVEDEEESEDS